MPVALSISYSFSSTLRHFFLLDRGWTFFSRAAITCSTSFSWNFTSLSTILWYRVVIVSQVAWREECPGDHSISQFALMFLTSSICSIKKQRRNKFIALLLTSTNRYLGEYHSGASRPNTCNMLLWSVCIQTWFGIQGRWSIFLNAFTIVNVWILQFSYITAKGPLRNAGSSFF